MLPPLTAAARNLLVMDSDTLARVPSKLPAGCVYAEGGRRCHEPPVGSLPESAAHPEWPFCERHIQPGMHPRDLRGKLVRWAAPG